MGTTGDSTTRNTKQSVAVSVWTDKHLLDIGFSTDTYPGCQASAPYQYKGKNASGIDVYEGIDASRISLKGKRCPETPADYQAIAVDLNTYEAGGYAKLSASAYELKRVTGGKGICREKVKSEKPYRAIFESETARYSVTFCATPKTLQKIGLQLGKHEPVK